MFLNLVLKVQLLSAGIMPTKKLSYVAITLIRTLIVVSVGGMINAVFATNQSGYRTVTLGLLSCITFSTSLQIITKHYENSLYKVTEKLRQRLFPFTKKIINEEAEIEMEKKFWFILLLTMISCITPLYCPYFYFITKPGITLDDPDLQVIPFFMAFWKINNVFEYVSIVLLQLSVTSITILAYWSFTSFTIYVVVNLQKHVENLREEFHKVVKSYLAENFEKCVIKSESYEDKVYIRKRKWRNHGDEGEQKLNKNLTNVIKYQQFIYGYTDDFTTFVSRCYTWVFYWYISSTIVFAYSFLQVINDVVFFIKTLSMVIHGTLALYLYCLSAQAVNRMNESIQDAFYYTEWYYLPPKIRKTIIVVLTQSQRKHKITTFAMFEVNLNLFIRSLRIVYSVLNVILVAQKK